MAPRLAGRSDGRSSGEIALGRGVLVGGEKTKPRSPALEPVNKLWLVGITENLRCLSSSLGLMEPEVFTWEPPEVSASCLWLQGVVNQPEEGTRVGSLEVSVLRN